MYRVSMTGTTQNARTATMTYWFDDADDPASISSALHTWATSMQGHLAMSTTWKMDPALDTVDASSGQLTARSTIATWSVTGNGASQGVPNAAQALL